MRGIKVTRRANGNWQLPRKSHSSQRKQARKLFNFGILATGVPDAPDFGVAGWRYGNSGNFSDNLISRYPDNPMPRFTKLTFSFAHHQIEAGTQHDSDRKSPAVTRFTSCNGSSCSHKRLGRGQRLHRGTG